MTPPQACIPTLYLTVIHILRTRLTGFGSNIKEILGHSSSNGVAQCAAYRGLPDENLKGGRKIGIKLLLTILQTPLSSQS